MRVSPVSDQERIEVIDIIRGFALFGIFLVNMPTFHSPELYVEQYGLSPGYSAPDEMLLLFLDMFVQGKFYTMFSFLFGLGFAIFMSRAAQKGLPVYWLFSRRLLALLVFGLLHLLLLWYGDILHTYALAGFLLLLFYRRSHATILGWAFALLAAVQLLNLLALTVPAPPPDPAVQEAGWQKVAEAVAVYNGGSFSEWFSFRLQHEIPVVAGFAPIAAASVLPLFLAGLYAGKKGVFLQPEQHLPLIKRVWWISLLLSVPSVLLILLVRYGLVRFAAPRELAAEVFVYLSGVTLCFFYLSSILLLVRSERWLSILRPFRYAGQMSLTNYIGQTILSLLLFLGWNLYGSVSLLTGFLLCLAMFPLQVLASRFWLQRYRFGPLEWLWRGLTYGRISLLRLRSDRT